MWYIVYRAKTSTTELTKELDRAGVEHYIPTQLVERLNEDGTEMVEVEEVAIRNLVFLRTDQGLYSVVDRIAGLRAPFMDTMTGKPAEVGDADMNRFIAILKVHPSEIKLLHDPYAKFADRPLVRVKAGLFEGMEGRVVRVLRDRKLVLAVGQMAIAVSGIHRSLLEYVEESNEK